MHINNKLYNVQKEIDLEGNEPDVRKVRIEHQLFAERNKNLILNFSKQVKLLLVIIFITLGILIIGSSYYNDKISCEREGPTRTSLIALRNGFIDDAIAREKGASLEKGTIKASISLELAGQLRHEAARVRIKQLTCSGIPEVK